MFKNILIITQICYWRARLFHAYGDHIDFTVWLATNNIIQILICYESYQTLKMPKRTLSQGERMDIFYRMFSIESPKLTSMKTISLIAELYDSRTYLAYLNTRINISLIKLAPHWSLVIYYVYSIRFSLSIDVFVGIYLSIKT